MSWRRMLAAGAALCVMTGAALVAAPANAASNTLIVDAGSVLRPVTHVGSGALYGLSSETKPGGSLLKPLHLNRFVQPPTGSTQAGGAGSITDVDQTLIGAGAQSYIRMPDIYPDFPYRWVSWDYYASKVDTMVRGRLADKDLTSISGWELWNEPDGTWDTAKAGPFNDAWVRIYKQVRSLDTVTPIVGPSLAQYDHDYMTSFLTNAKANGAVPDVMSWHELLDGWTQIGAHVADYRAIEKSLGISPRPISINEYAYTDQVDVPHNALHYIAQFERNGIRDAERAFWYEPGTLDGLFYNGQPTGSYWLYKWYGDMAGNMLPVTPSGGLDGIASLDSSRKIVNVVFAGDSGSNSVNVKNLGALGSSVKVELSYTPSSGRSANVAAPTQVSTSTYQVTNGAITVPVSNMNDTGAYQLVITPQGGPTTATQTVYEAENATVVNGTLYSSGAASNGGYVGGLDGTGDSRADSFVDFVVNVPTAKNYSMAVRYANGGSATSTLGLATNGSPWSSVAYPSTGGWGTFGTVTQTVNLKAGYNVIRIAKGSPGFSGGSGFAELDSITLG